MKRSGQRWLASVSLLMSCTQACSAPEESSAVDCRAAAIIGGSEYAEYVALASSQEHAIVRLTFADEAGTAEALCTAVIVAQGAALTALHCVPPEASTPLLHIDSDTGDAAVFSVAAERHSSLDLALLIWDVEDAALHPSHSGGYPSGESDLVQIAGYGLTEYGELGVLRFATERIVESGDDSFRVSADHRAGSCYGDSGGPALSRAATAACGSLGFSRSAHRGVLTPIGTRA